MIHIALIAPEKKAYSTTFIQAHREQLEANISFLYGVYFPAFTEEDKPILANTFINKAKRLWFTRILGKKNTYIKREGLANFLKNNRIDAVLAEFGPVGAEIYPVCQKLNIPLIVHFHGFDAWVVKVLQIYQSQYIQMFKYASYLIAVSRDMEQQLIKLGASPEKVIYNCYGPRDDFFKLQPNFDRIQFLAVGRFVEKKASYLTILAFAKVMKQFPEARLIMVGDGELLQTCKNIVQGLHINHAVSFTGALSHSQIISLFEQSYCFVQHSIVADNGDSEGTPVAILEASAASLPIVSTSHAGIKDVVIHGKTGFLVAEKDIDAMSDYMIQLAENRDLAIQMGQQGRRFIQENYAMQKHIALLDEIIQQSVKK